MAFSLEDKFYFSLYGAATNPGTSVVAMTWATERMREMAPFAEGVQIADENLGRRSARILSDASLARVGEIRAARDPEGRFHSWMKLA